jgi:molybdopterin-containing oxidoreductase family iron-sulfur binding subunit
MKTPPIDPELLRDRLSVAQGKQYWRSLEELADTPGFREMLEREFPSQAWKWTDPVSRRRFLSLMGASLALAGLSGCFRRPPGVIMPYVRQPEQLVLGKPLFFATSMTLAGFATGLLVESHEGRPTKIEGNPQHPASRGATDLYNQAAILGLYDPDRAQTINYHGRVRSWSDMLELLRQRLTSRARGRGVALLTEAVGSPTLAWQLRHFLADYPQARWFQYEPADADAVRAGGRLAFGRPVHTYPRLAQADVIVSLDADFLSCGPGHLANVRAFSARRRQAGGKAGMNRLYVVESNVTPTGASADHRLALKPSQVETFARALAAKLGVAGVEAPALEGEAGRWVEVVARDLQPRPRGTTLVLAGEGQPAAVHALAHALNDRLGNLGQTVIVTEPILSGPEGFAGNFASLRDLYKAVEAGKVDTLFILGGNPAYTAPADLPFADLLRRKIEKDKDWLALHLSPFRDETSLLCHWHVPEAHFLEAWSDARAFDGTASIVQPLIAPLYGGRSAHEILAALTHRRTEEGEGKTADEYDTRPPYELVRDHWREHRPEKTREEEFERFWRTAVHDGLIAGTAVNEKGAAAALRKDWVKDLEPAPRVAAKIELAFALDPTVYDGRFANNGWLQELPKPITRLTWDNAAIMSPQTAKELGVGYYIARTGGEHGNTLADMVVLEHDGRKLEVAAWVQPGHADGAVTLHLGYGRTQAGRVGGLPREQRGFDANRLRTSAAPAFAGVEMSKAGRRYQLACVQEHHTMAGRDVVRSGTLAEYRANREFLHKHDHGEEHNSHGHGKPEGKPANEADRRSGRIALGLYPADEHRYEGYKWGMAIDLSACVGCGACVVACQAENNIPVVGKEEVTRGREMHWLRIDRYYTSERGAPEKVAQANPRVYFQPVPCMHCENAPCELVCPVEATVHSDEGLNDMVYNRCVGTRYCSNNCPYKVRRFNFLLYSDYTTPSLKLMRNPDVTVRSRGVMEKCTYCVQRISYARIESAKEALDEADLPADQKKRTDASRPGLPYIHDGEVLTACQAACPAEAIVFGDLNDTNSRVRRLQESSLTYGLLAELGTRPRTTYLAALRNPNPELEAK